VVPRKEEEVHHHQHGDEGDEEGDEEEEVRVCDGAVVNGEDGALVEKDHEVEVHLCSRDQKEEDHVQVEVRGAEEVHIDLILFFQIK